MRIAVCGIVELIGPNGVGQFLGQAPRELLVLVRIAVRHRGDFAQLRAQRLDDLILLGSLIVGHDDDALIAPCIADVREANAGVAGGALDDSAARLQRAAALGIQYDPFRRTILHRAAGIHALRFAQDFAASLVPRWPQSHQPRIANRIVTTVIYIPTRDA